MATSTPELSSRVAVLEHGLTRLESKVDSGMADLRQQASANVADLRHASANVAGKLDTLIGTGAGHKPNYYAAIGLVVAVVSIIGAIFSLAEWRVGVASAPTNATLETLRRQADEVRKEQIELQIEMAREKAIREFLQKGVKP